MGYVVAGIAIIWGAGWLIWQALRLIGELLDFLGRKWDRTNIVDGAKRHSAPVAAIVRNHPVWSAGMTISLLLAPMFIAGLGSRWLVPQLDGMFSGSSCLLGWAAVGLGVGVVMSFASRFMELRWLGRLSVERVPDISHLREGVATGNLYFRFRKIAAPIVTLFLVVLLLISVVRSLEYDRAAPIAARVAAVAASASGSKMAYLNSALEDALDSMSTRPKEGIGLLASIKGLDRNGADSEAVKIARVASEYLDTFRDETEKAVLEGKPDALARSEAFFQFDMGTSLVWQGRLYASGKGGANQDLIKAFSLYSEAAAAGDKRAETLREGLSRRMVTVKSEGVREAVFKFLESKAQSGVPADRYRLGEWYAHSDKPEDHRMAEEWLVKAMIQDTDTDTRKQTFITLQELNDVEATTTNALDNLALLYAIDEDKRIKVLASPYLERRAKAGYPEAMLWMGQRYAIGDGVVRDPREARTWFLRAAVQDRSASVRSQALAALGVRNRPAPSTIGSKAAQTDSSVSTSATDTVVRSQSNSREMPPSSSSGGSRTGVPLNASLSSYGKGWMCNSGFRQSGQECVPVQMPSNAKLDYSGHGWMCDDGYRQGNGGCVSVQIPVHGRLDYSGHGWMCDDGYRQGNGGCVSVQIPVHGRLDYSGHGWMCDDGYRQANGGCVSVEIPVHGRLDYSGHGWMCDDGYRQANGGCVSVEIPVHGRLDYSGHGWMCDDGYRQANGGCVSVEIPVHGRLDYSGHGWMCDDGYRQVNGGCVLVQIPEHGRLDYSGHGWMCDTGYRQARNACVRVGE